MNKNTFLWIAQIATAVILLQTLYFKFSAAPESVYLFTQVGMEPYGRIGIGVLELISGILLLVPRWDFIVAVFGISKTHKPILADFTPLLGQPSLTVLLSCYTKRYAR